MTRRNSSKENEYPTLPCTKSERLGRQKAKGRNQCMRRSNTYHDDIMATANPKQANVMHLDITFPILKPNTENSFKGASKNIPTSHINNDTPISIKAVPLPDTKRPCHDLLQIKAYISSKIFLFVIYSVSRTERFLQSLSTSIAV